MFGREAGARRPPTPSPCGAKRSGGRGGVRAVWDRGGPETALPFGGLVYRQALELLHGVRDVAATKALIVQENRQYARRQLIWFRKEPNLRWFDGPGESAAVIARVTQILAEPDESHS